MKCSMTGDGLHLNTGDCLIEVTALSGLTTHGLNFDHGGYMSTGNSVPVLL